MMVITADQRDAGLRALQDGRAELAAIAADMERGLAEMKRAIATADQVHQRLGRRLATVNRLEDESDRWLQRLALLQEKA